MTNTKMKGKIFKANEITSILSKEKTMFREVIKHRHLFKIHNVGGSSSEEISEIRNAPLKMDDNFDEKNDVIEYLLKNSPYQVGQKIFCKESWCLMRESADYETGNEYYYFDWDESIELAKDCLNLDARASSCKSVVCYPADGEDENPAEMFDTVGIGGKILSKKEVKWRSAKSMPQWASRLTLLIKEIKVERLASISEEDCLKEGIRGFYSEDLKAKVAEDWKSRPESYLRKWGFKELWNATHKKPEEKFEASPFCWVIGFEVIDN